MSASLSGVFNLQEFTDLGVFAVGGRLYTYSAGTTTLKLAYTDEAGTIPHTYTSDGIGGQYIALNARGELPAPLLLAPGGYDLALKTAAGATIWTRRAAGTSDAAADAAADVLAQLASPSGDASLGVQQPFTGAVATTQHLTNAQYTFGFQFGIDSTGVADSTVALQNLVNSKRNPKLDYGSTVKLSALIDYPSDTTLDLNFSVVNWAGATVTGDTKAARWDNAVFRCNTLAPSTVKSNVRIKNGTINCNNWGCGVSLKQVEGFKLKNLTITQAVAAGIHVADCIDGTIEGFKLVDCAANPASGFDPATDLEAWSDGVLVWYGSQAITVANGTVVNTRAGTGRGGIVIDDAAGGSVESGRKTSAITVRNVRVQGYDRQVHLEYCEACSVEDSVLSFVDSGAKTFSAGVVDWNTADTVWKNNRVRTTKCIAMICGSTNVLVLGGSWKKTGSDTASNAFANQGAVTATVKFKSVDIDTRGSNANLYRYDILFEDCTFTSLSGTLCDAYEGRFRWLRTTLTCSQITNRFGLTTDRLSVEDCPLIGYAGTAYAVSVPAGKAAQLYLRKLTLEPGDVRVNCGTNVIVNDMEFNTIPTFDGSPITVQLDGEFLMSSIPVVGSWVKGQKLRNTNPAAGTNYGFICTTSGTFGGSPPVFKTYGEIQA